MAFWYDLRRRLFQDPDRGTHPRQPYALGDRQMYSVASSDNMRPRIVICAPDRLEQTEDIVDQLQSGSSVLLNLATLPDACWILSPGWHITMTIRSGGLLAPRT